MTEIYRKSCSARTNDASTQYYSSCSFCADEFGSACYYNSYSTSCYTTYYTTDDYTTYCATHYTTY